MTKRIIWSTDFTSPVAAHSRSAPGTVLRGPASHASWCFVTSMEPFSCRRRDGFGRCFLRWGGEIFLLDPSSLDARLHDQCFDVIARQIESVENAGISNRLAVLALAPAEQVIGRTAGQIFRRLDAILAQLHQHGGSDTGKLLELVCDAEFLA